MNIPTPPMRRQDETEHEYQARMRQFIRHSLKTIIQQGEFPPKQYKEAPLAYQQRINSWMEQLKAKLRQQAEKRAEEEEDA